MQKIDYNKQFLNTVSKVCGRNKLLLHVCCAPCACGVLGRLTSFDVSPFFYNPNIDTLDEYMLRSGELKKLFIDFREVCYNKDEFCNNGEVCSNKDKFCNNGENFSAKIKFQKYYKFLQLAIIEPYNSDEFLQAVKGDESAPEGGSRCKKCIMLRLEKTALTAAENGFEWFCSTLSVSPHKNAEQINIVGEQLSKKYGVKFLPNDFKKQEGFKESINASTRLGIYRQNYCGCKFSK